jgi:hypothetical protein
MTQDKYRNKLSVAITTFQISPFFGFFHCRVRSYSRFSNIYLITPKHCTIFIHCLYLLCFSYVFLCYRYQYQGELVCPLLKVTCFDAAIVYGYHKSYVVNIKGTTLHLKKLQYYTMVKTINFALPCSMLKTLRIKVVFDYTTMHGIEGFKVLSRCCLWA